MSKHSYIAELKANIELNDSDFNLLLDCSARHYDSTVRSISEVGGFLYGLNNRRNFSNGADLTTEFSERELGLLIKSIEFTGSPQSYQLFIITQNHILA